MPILDTCSLVGGGGGTGAKIHDHTVIYLWISERVIQFPLAIECTKVYAIIPVSTLLLRTSL